MPRATPAVAAIAATSVPAKPDLAISATAMSNRRARVCSRWASRVPTREAGSEVDVVGGTVASLAKLAGICQ